VGEGDIALYLALTGSRHVIGSAAPVAHALGYPKRPLDDLLAFHLAFGKTVSDISLNAVANLGYADVRFLAPVYVGDTLAAESVVIGLKENSQGESGVVWVRYGVEGGRLERTDSAATQPPLSRRTLLLTAVRDFRVRPLSADGYRETAVPRYSADATVPVVALEVSIERGTGERYVRVMPL